jgi:hypothetical protein
MRSVTSLIATGGAAGFFDPNTRFMVLKSTTFRAMVCRTSAVKLQITNYINAATDRVQECGSREEVNISLLLCNREVSRRWWQAVGTVRS